MSLCALHPPSQPGTVFQHERPNDQNLTQKWYVHKTHGVCQPKFKSSSTRIARIYAWPWKTAMQHMQLRWLQTFIICFRHRPITLYVLYIWYIIPEPSPSPLDLRCSIPTLNYISPNFTNVYGKVTQIKPDLLLQTWLASGCHSVGWFYSLWRTVFSHLSGSSPLLSSPLPGLLTQQTRKLCVPHHAKFFVGVLLVPFVFVRWFVPLWLASLAQTDIKYTL